MGEKVGRQKKGLKIAFTLNKGRLIKNGQKQLKKGKRTTGEDKDSAQKR